MANTPSQSYEKHAHQPRLTGIAGLAGFIAFVILTIAAARALTLQNIALFFLAIAVLTLVAISRAYTVRLQDRIIRLEMQVRMARLGLESPFSRLSIGQLVALRFAGDAELPALAERAVREQLTADQIKRAVTDWQPDFHRT